VTAAPAPPATTRWCYWQEHHAYFTTASCDSCHTRQPGNRRHGATAAWQLAPAPLPQCTAATGKSTAHISTALHRAILSHDSTGNRRHGATERDAGTCATVHNGTGAQGKPSTQFSPASCDSCHTTTVWNRDMSHSNVTPGTCATCHNGTFATGKSRVTSIPRLRATLSPDDRLETGDSLMDHSNVTPGTCALPQRHSRTARLQATSIPGFVRHPAQDDSWKPATGSMDHSNVTPGTCATCHNGTLATARPPRIFPPPLRATPATRRQAGNRRQAQWITAT